MIRVRSGDDVEFTMSRKAASLCNTIEGMIKGNQYFFPPPFFCLIVFFLIQTLVFNRTRSSLCQRFKATISSLLSNIANIMPTSLLP